MHSRHSCLAKYSMDVSSPICIEKLWNNFDWQSPKTMDVGLRIAALSICLYTSMPCVSSFQSIFISNTCESACLKRLQVRVHCTHLFFRQDVNLGSFIDLHCRGSVMTARAAAVLLGVHVEYILGFDVFLYRCLIFITGFIVVNRVLNQSEFFCSWVHIG